MKTTTADDEEDLLHTTVSTLAQLTNACPTVILQFQKAGVVAQELKME
jgi:hypothetical protein